MKLQLKLFGLFLIILFFVLGYSVFSQNPESGLSVGDEVKLFNANDQNGDLWKLFDFVGKKYIVIYFYPGALTGGCTKQACSYRDYHSQLTNLNVEVVGVSSDPVKNLHLFEKIHNLNFTLLSDVNGDIAKIFGVPVRDGGKINRNIDGKEIELSRPFNISRWTYVLDLQGKIILKDTEVDAQQDSRKVLEFIKNL